MALFGIAPAVMRPTALALNIFVAGFTSFRYVRAGMFRWRTVWPFLVGAVPFAVMGGAIQLPGAYYRPLVDVVLIIGGIRLLWPTDLTTNQEPRDPPPFRSCFPLDCTVARWSIIMPPDHEALCFQEIGILNGRSVSKNESAPKSVVRYSKSR